MHTYVFSQLSEEIIRDPGNVERKVHRSRSMGENADTSYYRGG